MSYPISLIVYSTKWLHFCFRLPRMSFCARFEEDEKKKECFKKYYEENKQKIKDKNNKWKQDNSKK